MNKSQSMGMYVILAIVVLVFISTIFMSGPTTSTSEISYTNFLQKLENKEFSKIEKYDDMIKAAGGVDLQLLGIGVDGHIGFNEPGTKFDSLTHVVKLEQNTREVNSRFFKSINEVPTHAVTMGIKTVMNARSIILIATGKSKAKIVKEFIEGPITTKCPASILQLHPFTEVFLDEEAASLLKK